MWTDWTEMLVNKLRELKKSGFSAQQIADTLGICSRNAVIGKWNRLGESLPFSPTTQSTNGRRGGKAGRRAKPFKQVPKQFKKQGRMPPEPTAPLYMPPARGTGIDALLELQPDDCRWPIGRPGTEQFRFCGAARGKGSMYCDHHYVASIDLDRLRK